MKEKEVLSITAAIESHSTHPLAESIVKYAQHAHDITLQKPENVEDVTGFGLKGILENKAYKIGKADFIGEETKTFHNGISASLEKEGKTVVYISDEEGILGLIALKDTLRQETIAAIRELQSIGVEAIMITGDNEETAKAIASESNIKEYYASCLPETKVETIKKLKKNTGQ